MDCLAKLSREQGLLDAVANALARDVDRLAAEHANASFRCIRVSYAPRARVVVGQINKQIAADLGISLVTVNCHRGQLVRKMARARWRSRSERRSR